ncbi:MAG: hypothetical protein ACI9AQ_001245, partial [Dinoroseobacter sp.]
MFLSGKLGYFNEASALRLAYIQFGSIDERRLIPFV